MPKPGADLNSEPTAEIEQKYLHVDAKPGVKQHVSLEVIYDDLGPKLKAALLKTFGPGPPDPEDVIQQAFYKLMERKDREDIRDVHAFLWRTARNAVLGFKRRKSAHSKYDFEVEQIYFPRRGENSLPESILIAKQELEIINRALEHMPAKRRRAFILHKVEGLSVSEVARRLGISRTPAQKHVTKAMKDIARALEIRKRDRQK